MKVIFQKNKLKDKYIYDFKEFQGDTTLLKKIQGRIFAGCLDTSLIDTTFTEPQLFIDNHTIIGLFIKTNDSNSKFKPLVEYEDEKFEIIIEDGTDYSEIYDHLTKEIELLQLEIDYCKNKEEENGLKKTQADLREECLGLETPSIYDEVNFDDYFENIDDFYKQPKHIKKIGMIAGLATALGIGIVAFRKLKK